MRLKPPLLSFVVRTHHDANGTDVLWGALGRVVVWGVIRGVAFLLWKNASLLRTIVL